MTVTRFPHYWSLMLQTESLIPADYMVGVDIRRGLRDGHGDSPKTWIFRIPRSSPAAVSVIRVGHCAVGAIHNIHSCANSVMKLAGALLRFPRAWCHKCDDPPWPEVGVTSWQVISTRNGITYPTPTGLLLNSQLILVCLVLTNSTVVVGG